MPLTEDVEACVSELQTVALYFVARFKASLESDAAPDNRKVWSSLPGLEGKVPDLKYLPEVTCWYLSLQDGTGQLERSFSALRQILNGHCGPLLDVYDLAMLAFELPENEEDIVRQSPDNSRPQ